ncbi:MAG: hypothetical protein N3G80_00375 [Candidatus Micrarchaeota archaeon]|nr:hypothetical protein [Candidatus Micrarchaeota archaeon]
MGLDDLLISTGVDQLINLINEKGRIDIAEAAVKIGVPINTVEDWARALEEEGMIKIEYRLTRTYLVKKDISDSAARKKQPIQLQTQQMKAEVHNLLGKVKQGNQELSNFQAELEQMKRTAAIRPQDIEKLKSEISDLAKAYEQAAAKGSKRLRQLEQKIRQFEQKSGLAIEDGKLAEKIEEALGILERQEETIKEQLQTSQQVFESFSGAAEELKKRLQEKGQKEKIAEIQKKIDSLAQLKDELDGAIQAVMQEQAEISKEIQALQQQIREMTKDEEISVKRQFIELSKMEKEAARQKEAITELLNDALASVKSQQERLAQIEEKEGDIEKTIQSFRSEYDEIKNEVEVAQRELSKKQKEIEGLVKEHRKLVETIEGRGELIEGLTSLEAIILDLKKRQEELEKNLTALLNEVETFEQQKAAAVAETIQPPAFGGAETETFIEKIKLSEKEQEEFERKREELRLLIRKMWAESKEGRE